MTQQDLSNEPRTPTPTIQLSLRFSSTRRGARLARQLAVQQLTEWTGLPHDSDCARAVATLTAELTSNAVRHGSLPGRDFRLTLLLLPDRCRVEVTDTRPERLPPPVPPQPGDETLGRGLLIVQSYADRWGHTVHDAYTKTVWAEVQLGTTVS
ncbi:ATP-binding protein [Streptomyces sp. NPDC056637]|uniref:ATP-binding protein n=1 Tax=unclassified Streptomyces TaxID=2593676 RepID=UPI0036AF9A57